MSKAAMRAAKAIKRVPETLLVKDLLLVNMISIIDQEMRIDRASAEERIKELEKLAGLRSNDNPFMDTVKRFLNWMGSSYDCMCEDAGGCDVDLEDIAEAFRKLTTEGE